MGTPDFAVPSLKTLREAGHEITLVVAQPDRPAGRGRKISAPPIKVEAEKLGLPVYQPENVNSPDAVEKIAKAEPDIIAVTAFGQILKKRLLELPRYGCVNLHASLLPKLRGAAPIQRAIMEGFTNSGVTTMMMARRMDAGDILLQQTVELGPSVTFGELHDELAEKGASLMAKTLSLLAEGKIKPLPQNEADATYAPKIDPKERRIDWNESAEAIDRKVRALAPAPGAFTFFNGKRVILRAVERIKDSATGKTAGRIAGVHAGCLEVETGNGRLAVLQVKPEGKREMPADSWAHGAGIGGDSCFSNEDKG